MNSELLFYLNRSVYLTDGSGMKPEEFRAVAACGSGLGWIGMDAILCQTLLKIPY